MDQPGTRPLCIAHRGASAAAPENTFGAFDLALRQGADHIEFDVRMTRDGALVVVHDATLDRVARGPIQASTGPVVTKTLAQVKRCDAGRWFNEAYPSRGRSAYEGLQIPTLNEIFARYGDGIGYCIEVKDPHLHPGIEERLLATIDAAGPVTRKVFVQSFAAATLQRIHSLDEGVSLIQLYQPVSARVTKRAWLSRARRYAVGIGIDRRNVTTGLIRAAHDLGLQLHAYTVNGSRNMVRTIEQGVDGIISDHPWRLRNLLAARRPADPLPDRLVG